MRSGPSSAGDVSTCVTRRSGAAASRSLSVSRSTVFSKLVARLSRPVDVEASTWRVPGTSLAWMT